MLKKEQRVVPLYYQVQHTVASRIRRGEYPPGSQLPSESELSRELSVSRVTVREALRALSDDKLVVKAQGRGTFVAKPLPSAPPDRRFSGYLEDLYEQLPRVSVRHVEIARVPATGELRAMLRLPPDDSEVVRLKRARYLDGMPYAFTTNLLPLSIGARVDEKTLRAMPLVRFLEEDLKIPITGASETIEAAAAEPEIARWLGIPALSPVMHVRRMLFTADRRPLELVDSYYRADRFHYSVELVRIQDNGRWSWSDKARQEGTVDRAKQP